ncbi:MAG: DUF5916 domain-containing protein, partial [Myxococcota bacterium]|nr:DUF5916 domain-containing protein [Myxococcota bacterium]
LDLRMGLTPDTGAALTINPDFSQVESDSTRVDLNQRFALWYPERRPFFLDGVDSFEDPAGTLYSRSIVEPIYGAKISGREGRLAIGVLDALDQSPSASVHEWGSPGFDEDDVEQAWAQNRYLRMRLDAGQGSAIGWTFADKRLVRSPSGEPLEEAEDGDLPGRNQVLATDAEIPLGRRWTVAGQSSWTHTEGLGLGNSTTGVIGRASGIGTGFEAGASGLTEDYRKEMGFMNQSGGVAGWMEVDHTYEPEGSVDTITPRMAVSHIQGTEGSPHEGDLSQSLNLSSSVDLGVFGFYTNLVGSRVIEDSVEVPGWTSHTGMYGEFGANFSCHTGLARSRTLDWDLLVPADQWRSYLNLTLRPDARSRVEVHLDYERFTPEGEISEQAMVVWSRLQRQLSREWGLRMIGEVATGDAVDIPRMYGSGLVTWLSSPGTEAYIGVTQVVLLEDEPWVEELVLFTKVSWLFQG